MSDDMSANVKIGAEVEGLKKGLLEAQNAVESASSQMSGAFAGVSGAFSKFNGALIAVGTTLAGGKAFSGAIESAKDMTSETLKLSMVLGMPIGEASNLRTALGDAYISVDEFAGANAKLSMKLKDNEEDMNKMGVKTRDSNGHLLDQKTIFMNAVGTLKEYKEGVNRNAAANELFGKSGQEALKFLKLNNDLLEEAKKKNEELNLVITDKNVEATKQYNAAMNDVGDVFDAINKVISEAVMPILTDLANWFASIGPKAVNLTREALAVTIHFFKDTWISAELLYYKMSELGQLMTIFGNVVKAAFSWDGDIKSEWDKGMEELKTSVAEHAKQIAEEESKNKINFEYNMDKGQGSDKIVGSGEGKKQYTSLKKGDDEAKNAAKRAMKEYENEFSRFKENLRAKNGEFYEMSKQEEHDFWATCLADVSTKGKEYENARLELEKKVRDLQHEARKEDLDNEIESLKFKASLDAENAQLKADIYNDIFNKISILYGKDTREYREALLNKMAADKEYEQKKIQIETETAQKIADLKSIYVDSAQDDLEANLQMGIITEEEKLQSIKALEEQRYQIKADTLAKELELNRMDLEKTRQLNDQKELIDADYAAKKKSIDNQIRVASASQWVSMANSMQGSLSSSFQAMANGTLKFSNFVKGIIPAIGQAFMKVAADMAAEWLIKNTVMAAISAVFKAKDVAIHNAGEVEKTSVEGTFSLARIGIAMGEMFAKLTAFYAFLGPAAPAAAGATVAAVGAAAFGMVRGAMKSASGGYDIPTGVNPMTQLHQEEMVLPAHIANPLRDSLNSGGGIAGSGTNITINAIDAKGVKALFMEHGSSLVTALKAQNRAFGG